MSDRDVRRNAAWATLGQRYPRATLVLTRNPVARTSAQAQIGSNHPWVTLLGWVLPVALLVILIVAFVGMAGAGIVAALAAHVALSGVAVVVCAVGLLVLLVVRWW